MVFSKGIGRWNWWLLFIVKAWCFMPLSKVFQSYIMAFPGQFTSTTQLIRCNAYNPRNTECQGGKSLLPFFNPFPLVDAFRLICSRQLLKTSRQREKSREIAHFHPFFSNYTLISRDFKSSVANLLYVGKNKKALVIAN